MSYGIPIVLASDDNYAPFVAVSMASACYSTREHIRFYVLDSGISTLHKRQISELGRRFSNFDLVYINIDDASLFSHLPACQGFPLSMYSRLLIPQLCDEARIIYSDVDVIFLNDVAEFYEQDITGYALGGIYHAHHAERPAARAHLQNLQLPAEHLYFYGGNWLIDCEKWRRENISTGLLRIAEQRAGSLRLGDQDVLNIFFACSYKQLDNRFCLTTQDCEYFSRRHPAVYRKLMQSVVVRHFETRRKPWLTNMYTLSHPIEHFEDFWFFASMTPFHAGLQQTFTAAIRTDMPPEYKGNVSINRDILQKLRGNVRRGSASPESAQKHPRGRADE